MSNFFGNQILESATYLSVNCPKYNHNKMHVSRINITTANSHMRKHKFKEGEHRTAKVPLNIGIDNQDPQVCTAPLFSLECNRLDKTNPYQRLMLGKLSHLQSLSQHKYTGTPQRRKNSSVQDKVRQKIMAAIAGQDLYKITKERNTENLNSQKIGPRVESRASTRAQCDRDRPWTVDILITSRRKRCDASVLLQPCQISPKPLSSRPVKFFPATHCSTHRKYEPKQIHCTSVLLNTNRSKQCQKNQQEYLLPPGRFSNQKNLGRRTNSAHFDEIETSKPIKKVNQEIKPWDSFEFEEGGHAR